MYLRSISLSLLVVANMGAVDKLYLGIGAAELAAGSLGCWLAKEAKKVTDDSITQMCENKYELKKMGAKITKRWVDIGPHTFKVPQHIIYPYDCSQANRDKIDKHFSDFKVAFLKSYGYCIGGIFVAAVSATAGIAGLITMFRAYNS